MQLIRKAETVGKDIRTVRPLQKFLLLDVLRDKDSRRVFYRLIYWHSRLSLAGRLVTLLLRDQPGGDWLWRPDANNARSRNFHHRLCDQWDCHFAGLV